MRRSLFYISLFTYLFQADNEKRRKLAEAAEARAAAAAAAGANQDGGGKGGGSGHNNPVSRQNLQNALISELKLKSGGKAKKVLKTIYRKQILILFGRLEAKSVY